jgi:hypothetical protein
LSIEWGVRRFRKTKRGALAQFLEDGVVRDGFPIT